MLKPLVLLGLAFLPTLAGAQTPPSPVIAAASLRTGPARTVENLALKAGHAEVRFTGAAAPLQAADRTVGYVLEGGGTLTYTSAYAREAPIFPRNMEGRTRAVPAKKETGLEVQLPFTRARLTWLGLPAPDLGAVAAADLAPSAAALAAAFAKVESHDPAQFWALQAYNPPVRPYALLELQNADETWIYELDGVHAMQETLALCLLDRSATATMKGRMDPVRMSRQPLGWDPKAAPLPPPFLIQDLDVDLRTADNRTMEAVVVETIMPLEDGARALRFGLMHEAVTVKDVRKLVVRSVKDEQNRSLGFHHDKDALVVALAAPAQKGRPFKLRFEYSGDFLIQPGGDSYWQLGVRGLWYPEAESLMGELYTFHGQVRTKGEWHAFLPGDTVRREKDGEWNLLETRSEKPLCFATVLGGRYYMDEETRDGLTVRIATYAFKPGVGNKVIKDQAFNVMKYYQSFLGPFPFKELKIVQVNQWGFGQAPPGMMYITNEAFNQHVGVAAYAREGLTARFAHEIAHQYWGIAVKMPSPEDQWVTESFADYCAALYIRALRGDGAFKGHVETWWSNAAEVNKFAPIPLANELRFKAWIDASKGRTYLLYDKGPALLNTLHEELGDQVFLTYLKSTQTNFRWRFATTKQLKDLLNFVTKKDYGPFFDSYFWGLEMPPRKK
jgi:hypothetical protein